jgi:hypothetical protein
LPPEEDISRFAPRPACTSHAWPMPRILNEPLGCSAFVFSHTRRRGVLKAVDSMRGVATCSGMAGLRQEP